MRDSELGTLPLTYPIAMQWARPAALRRSQELTLSRYAAEDVYQNRSIRITRGVPATWPSF